MAMQDHLIATPVTQRRVPWNKGKLTGAKPPLRPKHVWLIRTKLQIEGRVRDLAMFNLAIDSKLRGCDVVAIRVEDVAAGGTRRKRDSSTEEDRTARFELSEQTRQTVDGRCSGWSEASALASWSFRHTSAYWLLVIGNRALG
jgi:hypothetical protein